MTAPRPETEAMRRADQTSVQTRKGSDRAIREAHSCTRTYTGASHAWQTEWFQHQMDQVDRQEWIGYNGNHCTLCDDCESFFTLFL